MKVLHVPYVWMPDPCGGTEVYVRALIRCLADLGHANEVVVASPRITHAVMELVDGVTTHRLPCPEQMPAEILYGEGEPASAQAFARLLEERRPEVVHFHAFTPVVSRLWMLAAKMRGVSCVYTFHTPTLICARGTLLLRGRVPCDGEMKPLRCAECTLQGLGVPGPAAFMLALLSPITAPLFSKVPFRMWPLMRLRLEAVRGWLVGMNRVVVLNAWSKAVLKRNGLAESHLCVVRHGLAHPAVGLQKADGMKKPDQVRLGFFGRVDRAKGLGLLAKVLEAWPDLKLELHCHLIGEDAAEPGMQEVVKRLRADSRVRLHPTEPPESVIRVMSGYDAVLVPSLGFETGPLVVLEAFAAGVPVIGSDLGGIAEWVTHEADGLLCPPGDVKAWGDALERFTMDAALRQRLCAGVRPPPAMSDVAARMVEVYMEARSDTP